MMGQLKKFLKDNPSITGTNIIKLAFIGMMLAIIPTSFVAVQSFKFVRPQAAYDTSPPAPPTVTPTPGPGYKLTVTSPKGGETWSLGKANTITWTFDAQNQPFIPYPVDTTITLTKVAADGSMRNQYTIADRTAKTNIGANSYTWNIPTAGIETGTYRVLIQLWKLYQAPGGGAAYPYGVSAADFTIGINVPPSYTTQLRSPNGGEHFFTGHVYTAKWNFQAANAPAVIYPINTTIALQQGDNTKGWREVYRISDNVAKTQIGDNTFDWTPPASLPEGSYRMVVQMNIVYSTGGGYSSNDQSDGDFTIGNLVSVTPPPVTPTPTPQYPYVTGCIKSPAYSGDQCSGYRYAASTTLYPGCYANYDQCVNAVAPSDGYKGTCIPVQQTGCNGYRYMPGLSRSCYSLEQCQALGISPTPILPTTVVPTITPTPPRPTVIVPTYTLTPTPIRPTATPTPQITSGACKEGVNSFVVFNPCGNGNYRNATYSCYDGFTSTIGDPTSCKPSLVWQQYAIQNCVGHSSCKTTPTPTKVPIPTPPPIVVKGSCQYGVTSFTPGQSCGNGMSTYATYTCVNNKSGRAGDGVCRPYSQLMLYSYQNCQSQLYCIPTPTPIPWWWRWLPRR